MAELHMFIEAGFCPCGGELETEEDSYVCKRCGWRVLAEKI